MKNTEKTLGRKVRSSCFSVILVILSCGCCSAALLIRILILPSSRLVRCTGSLQNFSRPTSPASNKHLRPSASTSRFVSLASGLLPLVLRRADFLLLWHAELDFDARRPPIRPPF